MSAAYHTIDVVAVNVSWNGERLGSNANASLNVDYLMCPTVWHKDKVAGILCKL